MRCAYKNLVGKSDEMKSHWTTVSRLQDNRVTDLKQQLLRQYVDLIFLLNFGSYKIHTASHPTIRYSLRKIWSEATLCIPIQGLHKINTAILRDVDFLER
jgi:hypothetical protein